MSNTATALAALFTALISGALATLAAYKSHQSERNSASAAMVHAESEARAALADDFREGLKDCRAECRELRERMAVVESRNEELRTENADLRRELNSIKSGKN